MRLTIPIVQTILGIGQLNFRRAYMLALIATLQKLLMA